MPNFLTTYEKLIPLIIPLLYGTVRINQEFVLEIRKKKSYKQIDITVTFIKLYEP